MSTRLVVDDRNELKELREPGYQPRNGAYPDSCENSFIYFSSFIYTRIYCMVPDHRATIPVWQFYSNGKADHHFAVLYHVQFFPFSDGFARQRVGISGFHFPENAKGAGYSLYRLRYLLFLDELCIAKSVPVFQGDSAIVHGNFYCLLPRSARQYLYESKHARHFHGHHDCLYGIALFYSAGQLYSLSFHCLFNSRTGMHGKADHIRP